MNTLQTFHFSEEEIGDFFDISTLFKGRKYFQSRKVVKTTVEQDGDCVTVIALVEGSLRKPYQLVIQLFFEGGKLIEINDVCSCPLGECCKHAVAALYEVASQYKKQVVQHPLETSLSRHQAQHHPRWDPWLQQLSGSFTRPITESSSMACLYIVGGERLPQLKLAMARLLKKGGYGKCQSMARISQYYLEMLPDQDRHLFAQLEAAASMHSTRPSYTSGEYNVHAIPTFSYMNAIIETGRCFLGTNRTTPLTIADHNKLFFRWIVNDEGQYSLQPSIEGISSPIILPFKKPWYIDPEKLVCGPLETDFSHDVTLLLLNTPSIPLEDVPHFSEALEKRVPQLPTTIQPPQHLPPEEIRVNPNPRLRLYGSKQIFDNQYYIQDAFTPLIELGFVYGEIDVPLDFHKKEVHRMVHGKYLKVIRDLDREKEWLALLQNLPLKPLSTFFPRQKISASYANHFSVETSHVTALLEKLRHMQKNGWKIDVAKTFPHPWIEEVDNWYIHVDESNARSNWFDVELGVEIEGSQVNLIPILQRILENPHFSWESIQSYDNKQLFSVALDDGRKIGIPGGRLRYLLNTLFELYDAKNKKLSLSQAQAAEIFEWENQLSDQKITWKGGENLKRLGEKLKNFQHLPLLLPPTNLQATLRPYQQVGLTWLQFLREGPFGGILADDMGLGKTIQTLAHLLLEKEEGRMKGPSLIVAPTSLMMNWKNEAARFAPDLKVLILQGLNRKQFFSALPEHDLVLTTYPLLVRDQALLLEHAYYYLILDEAQFIKNAQAKATQVVNLIEAQHRLCLTGTPMENHLGELWTLFHFLSPGLLGNQKQFNRFFRAPIEQHNNQNQQQLLSKRIAPFLLRRLKEEVAQELPPKTEIIHRITLEGEQRDLYETIRVSMHEKVKHAIQEQGLAKSQIILLDALLKMRQVCCDPRLVKLDAARSITQSQKLNFLFSMLSELFHENRKILIFSSFTSMLELIEEKLVSNSMPFVKLTGQTKNREEVIASFQQGRVPLFLISLKAGGTGLNLTAADTVIHYDPWWNPAAELQATDRAHRIGQQKPVFVYKLLTAGTIEEKILKLQEKKQALISSLFEAQKNQSVTLSTEDLEDLFRPLDSF